LPTAAASTSAYLAYIASRTLGDRAVDGHRRQSQLSGAPTARWPSASRASSGCATRIIKTSELDNPDYRANPSNRCYFCKHELYTHLSRLAADRHASSSTATTRTTRGDYRPGRQAAREFGVLSPLDEVNLNRTKSATVALAACPPGTSPHRRVCRRASRITPSDPTRSCGRSNAPSRRFARSASGCFASPSLRVWPASKSPATRWPRAHRNRRPRRRSFGS